MFKVKSLLRGIIFFLLLSLSHINSYAISCDRSGSSNYIKMDMSSAEKHSVSRETKKNFPERLKSFRTGHKVSWFDRTFGGLAFKITGSLSNKTPGNYYFYYLRRGIPQEIRFMVKVGVSFDQTPTVMKQVLNIELTQSDIKESKKRLNAHNGITPEMVNISNETLEKYLRMISRYKSLKEDLYLLELAARLKIESLERLESLLNSNIQFPLEVILSEKIDNRGNISEAEYRFNHREQLEEHIRVIKKLDHEKLAAFENMEFLIGRYREQAELRGILYILKSELQTYNNSFKNDRIRKRLLEVLNDLYYSENLIPPREILKSQYVHEMHWEVARYLGEKINNSDALEAQQHLRLNDIDDLGVIDNPLNLGEKLRRLILISAPLQVIAASIGFGTPVLIDHYNYLINDKPAKAIAKLDESQRVEALQKYFNKYFDFNILKEEESWPPEIKEEFERLRQMNVEYEKKQEEEKKARRRLEENFGRNE